MHKKFGCFSTQRCRGVGRSSNAMNDEPGLYSLLETTLVDILALINPDSDDMVRRWQTIRDIRFIVHSVPTLKGTELSLIITSFLVVAQKQTNNRGFSLLRNMETCNLTNSRSLLTSRYR